MLHPPHLASQHLAETSIIVARRFMCFFGWRGASECALVHATSPSLEEKAVMRRTQVG